MLEEHAATKMQSCYFETTDNSSVCCIMNTKKKNLENEVILIDDSDDVGIAENAKLKDVFPCTVTRCNESREHGEPEHALQCLIVKILKENKPPVHIEKLCTYLSKRYKYYYNIPYYRLVPLIKSSIKTQQSRLKHLKVVLNEKDECVLLPNEDEDEVISLDSEEEEDLDVGHDAMVNKKSLKIVCVESIAEEVEAEMTYFDDDEEMSLVVDEETRTEAVEANSQINLDGTSATQNKDGNCIHNSSGYNKKQSQEQDYLLDIEDAPLVIVESPPQQTLLSKDSCDTQHLEMEANVGDLQKRVTRSFHSTPQGERKLRSSSSSRSGNEQLVVTKPEVPKIGLPGILNCLRELQLTTFSIHDIMDYYESRFEVTSSKRLYSTIYKSLHYNQEKYFRKTMDEKWVFTSFTSTISCASNIIDTSSTSDIDDTSSTSDEERVPRPQVLTAINLVEILNCIKDLQLLTTFSLQDIIDYFESRFEISFNKGHLCGKIYWNLKQHEGQFFKRTVDGKWFLINPELLAKRNPELPKVKSKKR